MYIGPLNYHLLLKEPYLRSFSQAREELTPRVGCLQNAYTVSCVDISML